MAIIGKPSPNGEIIDLNTVAKREKMACKRENIIRAIYNANCEMDLISYDVPKKSTLYYIAMVSIALAIQLIPYIGFVFFVILIVVYFSTSYSSDIDNFKENINTYNNQEPQLKKLISLYGYDAIINLYKSIENNKDDQVSIKHIGA